jgi:Ca2+-transporting ATPase
VEGDKWYTRTIEETLACFKTNHHEGLSSGEAKQRLAEYGYNELLEKERKCWWKQLLAQFQDFMVLVLLAATFISGLLGEYADAIAILVIVLVNAVLGFIQEYRAEQSMQALKKMSSPTAHVLRNGNLQQIPAREVVPGDIMILEAGDKPAADGRLMQVHDLETQEAALTGEALTVRKFADEICDGSSPLGDRKNMIYAGTLVAKGRGRAVVCATGMRTEVGRIAGMIQDTAEEKTPLERRLERLGKWLVWGCVVICLLVVITGVVKGEPVFLMCMAGISLAVAAIPEGLPAIVTVALALGVQRMIKRNAIVRKLPAVETLGCITVICSDKTGTLTQNAMTVKSIFVDGRSIEVTGAGYEITGQFLCNKQDFNAREDKSLQRCLEIGALCNNSILKNNNVGITGVWRRLTNKRGWSVEGDPTEGALVVAAGKAGVWREDLEKRQRRLKEIPFASERCRMSVVYQNHGGCLLYVKGAPDVVISRCRYYWDGFREVPITDDRRREFLAANDEMTAKALRVLAMAFRRLSADEAKNAGEDLEQHLVFAGLQGMIDPPRQEARTAIQVCRQAGIKAVMITGDHPNTAVAVARELQIYKDDIHKVLSGNEIDALDDVQLADMVNQVTVYARVSPAHKLRIVKALKHSGHIVAMTGDGVNDAPAVKEADIGVAMGIAGTDVTKEASAMILADDNFETIVAAVEEGRGIYDNIRKFIRYLLSCNLGEVLTMFVASLAGLPLPLLPVQVLWVNLVTDGLPAMALGVDPHVPDIMLRPPRNPRESVFSRGLSQKIIKRGFIIGLSTVGVFAVVYLGRQDLVLARTMAFCTLVFCQLFHVYDCRSEIYSIFEIGFFRNKYLVAATLCSIIMQLAVIYLPWMQGTFTTVPLDGYEWLIVLIVAGWTFFASGIRYVFSRTVQRKGMRIFNRQKN